MAHDISLDCADSVCDLNEDIQKIDIVITMLTKASCTFSSNTTTTRLSKYYPEYLPHLLQGTRLHWQTMGHIARRCSVIKYPK